MDWEPWFTRNNLGDKPWLQRPGAEGVPILGLYSSFNSNVVRQHAIWFAEAGINCILVDWSNNLWRNISWEDRPLDIQEIINATTRHAPDILIVINSYLIILSSFIISTSIIFSLFLINWKISLISILSIGTIYLFIASYTSKTLYKIDLTSLFLDTY